MHRFANPARFGRIARPLTLPLLAAGVLLTLGGAYAGLFLTPVDYLQGETVRILYLHVPAAWLAMGGWTGLALACLAQLVWKHPLAGVAAKAIAVPGAVFTGLCLLTGSIWGRPTWGTWWQWDGRMTSVLVLLFLYLAWLALADATEEEGTSGISTAAAIFGLLGAANIPIIRFSVVWWNSLHQPPSITLRGSAISPELLWPLGFTVTGFTLIFAAVVLMRMRALLASAKREARLLRMARA